MFVRVPSQQPFANSDARLALMLRSPNGVRMIEIGGRTVTAIILITISLFAWYLFATLYLVFRDDLVVSLISGQHRQHYAYEDRIAELRSRIDRMTARQLVNQDKIEDRVASLIARQAELEARQIMVADLGGRAGSAGIVPTLRESEPPLIFDPTIPVATGAIGGPAPVERSKPMPLDSAAPEPASRAPGKGFDELKMRGALHGIVNEVEKRTDRMERSQIETLRQIADSAQGTIQQSHKAIAALGLNPARFGKFMPPVLPVRQSVTALPALETFALRDLDAATQPSSAMGGPLLPAMPSAAAEIFESYFTEAETALRHIGQSRTILRALPLGRPMSTQHDITSSFGTRVDPFTRGYAMHSGIDFRAPTGTHVRAAAGGKVIEAGVNGGYGRMVEIDHGFGISTRYAHLSAIGVKEGDVVSKGSVIGQVGSTGRSTGPHLHYEVRIDDDATDPMRFVRAARMVDVN